MVEMDLLETLNNLQNSKLINGINNINIINIHGHIWKYLGDWLGSIVAWTRKGEVNRLELHVSGSHRERHIESIRSS